jgi:hypothetical protein
MASSALSPDGDYHGFASAEKYLGSLVNPAAPLPADNQPTTSIMDALAASLPAFVRPTPQLVQPSVTDAFRPPPRSVAQMLDWLADVRAGCENGGFESLIKSLCAENTTIRSALLGECESNSQLRARLRAENQRVRELEETVTILQKDVTTLLGALKRMHTEVHWDWDRAPTQAEGLLPWKGPPVPPHDVSDTTGGADTALHASLRPLPIAESLTALTAAAIDPLSLSSARLGALSPAAASEGADDAHAKARSLAPDQRRAMQSPQDLISVGGLGSSRFSPAADAPSGPLPPAPPAGGGFPPAIHGSSRGLGVVSPASVASSQNPTSPLPAHRDRKASTDAREMALSPQAAAAKAASLMGIAGESLLHT